MKIGVMFGSPETTTGGNALKFYSSVRLDIRRIGAVKDRDEVIGNETRVKVVKNKVAPPFGKPSSRSSTAKASTATARSSISACRRASSRSPALGTATKMNASAKARRTPPAWLDENPALRDEIEGRIRVQLLPGSERTKPAEGDADTADAAVRRVASKKRADTRR